MWGSREDCADERPPAFAPGEAWLCASLQTRAEEEFFSFNYSFLYLSTSSSAIISMNLSSYLFF